ncbi:SCO4402 family protein [Streptomyces sp. NBC_00654]|uniref:SCO4402 family protein n=1 Tax=Streptomyces sp. NBC_00654 TaxID=2975799 RepID=UPI0022585D2D|nr:hypothetical protein [Streptomyces sp. NBC_00654]MCX4967024.1 hypothetical protein [Streptomyces sp. NBC_00654]
MDDQLLTARARIHLVPAVLALANPPWQRDVWLDPATFENLDQVCHTLFDDFGDAQHPERYLGIGLRTEEEVVLMRQLDAALAAVEGEAPNDTDVEYLRAEGWTRVVTVAGRLAQVMVANDLHELLALHESRVTDPAQRPAHHTERDAGGEGGQPPPISAWTSAVDRTSPKDR